MSKVCDKYNQYLRMEDLKLPVFLNRDSVPKATWCLKRHGSLYLPVKKYKCGSQLNDATSS